MLTVGSDERCQAVCGDGEFLTPVRGKAGVMAGDGGRPERDAVGDGREEW